MTVTESDVGSWMGARLNQLKDSVVAVGGVVYLIGYLVWSFYAWRYDLGPVPALQGQYFVAGIAVSLVLAAAAIATYFVSRAAEHWWPAYLESRSPGGRRALFALTIALLLVAVLLSAFASRTEPMGQLVLGIAAITIFPFAISGFQVTRRVGKPLIRGALLVYVAFVAVFVVLQIVERWYPVWPQALGGGKPRMAYLTLKRLDAQSGGLQALVSPFVAANAAEGEVLTTSPLYVLVRTEDYLIVARKPPNPTFDAEPSRFEVPVASIVAIVWVDDV